MQALDYHILCRQYPTIFSFSFNWYPNFPQLNMTLVRNLRNVSFCGQYGSTYGRVQYKCAHYSDNRAWNRLEKYGCSCWSLLWW